MSGEPLFLTVLPFFFLSQDMYPNFSSLLPAALIDLKRCFCDMIFHFFRLFCTAFILIFCSRSESTVKRTFATCSWAQALRYLCSKRFAFRRRGVSAKYNFKNSLKNASVLRLLYKILPGSER